jgi:hypothetical protein
MKSYLKYTIAILFCLLTMTQMTSCSKDTSGAEINLSYQMLSDKTWYLDYSITGTSKKTYVGQSTYFIDFLKNKTTKDSDGLMGTYSVEKFGNILQIHVQAKTSSTNTVEYVYNIESIGSGNLVLYYTLTGSTVPTKLYFTTTK